MRLARRAPFSYSKAMLSVLIETRNDEEALARTLASLVGGAVEGMVREVIVCDAGSTDRTRDVADEAGCRYVAEGGIAAGIKQSRGDWLLLLEPGARLEGGWIDAVAAHTGKGAMAARFSRAKGSRAPFLTRIFARPRALEQGLLIAKRQAMVSSKKAHGAEAIARGLAVKTLRAEIWPAPHK
jgi:cellulose synthase/poly-beta-1,6-N-acetylglucosamine synthase-like glycosyltransferase